ncbi:MAG: hypothetical protein V1697_00305 [Candidatus Levyibacteriota bacterium]
MSDQNQQKSDTNNDSVPQQSQTSANVIHKETEPIAASEPLVLSSEKEPELHPEVKTAGVEIVSEAPKLTKEDAEAGITYAKEATPVETEPSGKVQLPMTEQKAEETLKMHKKIAESIRWLALSVLRQIKMMKGSVK